MGVHGIYTEPDILRRVAEGSETAFRALFDMHRNKLYAYMLRLSGNAETAKDIVQDVFLKVWMEKAALAGVQNFDAYLFTLARNHAFNLAKKTAYRNDILAQLLQGMELTAEATEHTLRYKNLQSRFEATLRALPPQQRLVFTMNRLEGIHTSEISLRLHISEGTVKKHLSLATQVLKSAIRHNLEVVIILSGMSAAAMA